MKDLLFKVFNDEKLISCKEDFLSETDFQFTLAKMLKKRGVENITLEYPVEFVDHKGYVDIYCKYNNIDYYIELKYKTKARKNMTSQRQGIDFCLKNHNAYTDNRYFIYKDIKRLEDLVNNHKNKRIGYVIFLTNVPNYEEEHSEMSLKDNTNKICKHTRYKEISLSKTYKCNWRDFKNHDGFRYLLIEVR